MRIALLGFGKMGKMIERIAKSRGHDIILKVNSSTENYTLENCDVAIDFSLPETAVSNIKKCIDNHIPVVSGTTGWLDHYTEVTDYCQQNNGAFLYASNFSIGVNFFFELNKKLAQLMQNSKAYKAEIDEIHHTQKLDAPSGTAITLADQIIVNSDYEKWQLNATNDESTLSITSHRDGDTPGTHKIKYSSAIDSISIEHVAHNREGFALGAVIAAEWIKGKTGIFSMTDVLKIG